MAAPVAAGDGAQRYGAQEEQISWLKTEVGRHD